MRKINVIRSFGGGLTPPLICQKPNTRGRYADTWSCEASDQDVYACREAMPSDTDPETWARTGCGRAVTAAQITAATGYVAPRAASAPQAPPPAVTVMSQRALEEERARILANQNRAEEERLARLRLQEEERQRQAVRQEQERQQLAQLERERLERERLAAEREQSRIQAELERNRRQLAERQGTGFTGTPAPAKTETAGSFPWWLLGLLLLQ
jgi:hypothetical protein